MNSETPEQTLKPGQSFETSGKALGQVLGQQVSDQTSGQTLGQQISEQTSGKASGQTGMDLGKIEQGVRLILEGIGEDPSREGLLKTPVRVAKMYAECFAGMTEDPAQHFETTFDEHHEEMVLVRDIPFYSMCEHHLAPFFGVAHVAYIPAKDGKICGLSKLARLVDVFARRPQVQERLTSQIADTLVEQLDPQGVIVVIEAEHLCMSMRGVKKAGTRTTTSAVRGIFRKRDATRAEALSLIFR